MSEKRKVLKLNLSLITYDGLLKEIKKSITEKKFGYICFANVHMIIEAQGNPNVSEAINKSLFTVTDGMPLVNALNLLYNIKQERISGMDFMPSLMAEAEKLNQSVFFYGGSNELLKKIVDQAKMDYPRLKICGTISPPYRKLMKEELQSHINEINKSGANYVFVGLGCPKQELWMAHNSSKTKAILFGVGGAFEVYAKSRKRAPKWMRNNSLEWLFRLAQEPKRLFKRYFITNSYFIYLILIELIKTKILKIQSSK